MKITNGKIIIGIGIIHTVCTLFLYVAQFKRFSQTAFCHIHPGFLAGEAQRGGPEYFETFAAFWCFVFGIFLVPLGVLVEQMEKSGAPLPVAFLWTYLAGILFCVYMIPAGGFTIFLLPHAIYMLVRRKRTQPRGVGTA